MRDVRAQVADVERVQAVRKRVHVRIAALERVFLQIAQFRLCMRRAHRLECKKTLDRVFVAIAQFHVELGEHAGRNAIRPVRRADEAWTRREHRESAHIRRVIECRAQRDQTAQRPADPERTRRRAGNAARAVGDVETRVIAAETVAGQIDDVQTKVCRQHIGQRRENTAMHRPAVDQHEVGPASLNIDMHAVPCRLPTNVHNLPSSRRKPGSILILSIKKEDGLQAARAACPSGRLRRSLRRPAFAVRLSPE